MLRGAGGDGTDVSRRKRWSKCLELPVKEAKNTCFPKPEMMNENVSIKFENELIKKVFIHFPIIPDVGMRVWMSNWWADGD